MKKGYFCGREGKARAETGRKRQLGGLSPAVAPQPMPIQLPPIRLPGHGGHEELPPFAQLE